MTDKNTAFLRHVLTDGVWVGGELSYAMMDEAKRPQNRWNGIGEVMAQIAVAIAIETIAPVRLRTWLRSGWA